MAAKRSGRVEDARLVTGAGRFTDDIANGPIGEGALHAVFVRSPHAAARITGIDLSEARATPGVIQVLTAEDLAADGIGPVQADAQLTGPDGRDWPVTPRPLLVADRVRHAGEPVALVLAATAAAAQDGAEAVAVDFEDLPAVAALAEARATGAPLVDDNCPGNLAAQWGRGDWDAVIRAIDAAPHQLRMVTPVSRVTAVALEPRAALARPEADGRMTLYLSHQNPQALRGTLADAFDLPVADLRVVAPDVGGSFGMKGGPLREEMLIFWAARRLDRAVRWRADRGEDFLTSEAGRDVEVEARLGLSEEGDFLAMSFALTQNMGAYYTGRSLSMMNNFGGVAGMYRTPLIAGRLEGYLTNTVPIAAYRGAGRPEATFAVEQLIDRAARQLGMDPVALRRRNLIGADQMPWTSPFWYDYDCGAFEQVLDTGIAQGDVAGFAARRAEAAQRGRLRGLGVALCIETAGSLYGKPAEDVTDLIAGPDGRLTLAAGSFSAGQGIPSTLIDLAAEALQIAPDRLDHVQGDTDVMEQGAGMGGSGAMVKGGSATLDAARDLVAQGRRLAARALDAAEAQITYRDGGFHLAGTNRHLSLEDIARRAHAAGGALRGKGRFRNPAPTFPNGCHVCEVEIDPETGRCEIAAYHAVEDIGRVLNPQLARGQIHGGVGQALGQIFMEQLAYSRDDAQLITGSFMDYAMPRAEDFPNFDCAFHQVPTPGNPLGVKGVGEAGSVGGLAAGMSAVNDALASAGVRDFAMPATPDRIWAALQAAGSHQAEQGC
ncbi:xanthine dehydrogenase family protein molybdopterin-binding subunit [Pseudooceanicola aestuarii]|uniref:xanthine dehydrogenase family protein molybdopterin-binding subunit n=1 Tax=Pseudooceanicola aestuarii TaxID=2697319 RepID=UPI0013D7262D|nr:xanthine dehydrogenase family protein molybdopterin-binding subunit [Pseudooceanicola aestuarii]